MNSSPKKSRKERRLIRPWTYTRALAALPYLRSVMQSLRDHRLEAQVPGTVQKRFQRKLGLSWPNTRVTDGVQGGFHHALLPYNASSR